MQGLHSVRLAMLAMVFLAIWNLPVLAQQPDPQVLDKAAMEIRKKNPNVDAALLTRDKAVIKATFPVIQADLTAKGFNDADVNAAVVTGWKDLRAAPGGVSSFNAQDFKVMISKLGKLRITSKPNGANIDINALRQDEKTDTAKWLKPGSYSVLLTKEGFSPEEERRTIVEGENPPITKTLTRRPQ